MTQHLLILLAFILIASAALAARAPVAVAMRRRAPR
jgi:hypothetical protein